MAMFKMSCTCGDEYSVDANDRDEAVSKMKGMMTQEAIDAHMNEKHAGQPKISMADCHAMIERDMVAA
jgi:hypothetical protein